MQVLKIETNSRLRKIRNPQKARDIDLGVWSIVQVMDGDGKWRFVGHTMFLQNAQYAVAEINEAIGGEQSSIILDYIS